MSFNKKFFATGGIVASSAECTTDTADIFGDGNGKALYSLDYDASDASGNYDGTPSNVTFGVGGQINYGARFNGSSSNIELPNTNAIAKTNDFSVSFWFKTNSVSTLQGLYGFQGNASSSGRHILYINRSGTGNISLLLHGIASYYSSNNVVSADTWHHIVVTKSSTLGAYVYLDKTAVISQSGATGNLSIGSGQNTIGNINNGSDSDWVDGDIDQFRIFDSVLDQTQVDTLYDEVACVYTATTTDNDYQGTTAAYYKLDNSAEDEKGSYDGTETDIEYKFGRYGQAAVFNGSSSKITTSYTTNDSAFTISGWIKHTSTTFSGKYHYLAGKGYYSSASNTNYWQLVNYSSEFPEFRIRLNASSVAATSSVAMTLNQWHHLAATVDSSGNMKIYLDGVLTGSATGAPSRSMSQGIVYGVYLDGTTYFHDGQIDQIRYYPTVLDADAIQNLYNEKPETDTSNFKTVLYEGTSSEQYISNVGYNLDVDNNGDGGLVWVKQRSSPTRDHRLYDTVRGIYPLYSSRTLAEGTSNTIEYDANGFFFAGADSGVNETSEDYVAWVWKGGGAKQNGTGTNVSNVEYSANTEAGFSIVKYTGGLSSSAGASASPVSHGLGAAPNLIMFKNLDNGSENWHVYGDFGDTPWGKGLRLNNTNDLDSTDRNISAPDSTNFYTQYLTVMNTSGNDHIAYCFRSISGYSNIGTYEGNGTTATTTITTDFEPSWVMIKRIDSANSWVIFDNKRDTTSPLSKILYADTNDYDAEGGTTTSITISSTGFSMSTSQYGGSINTDGGQYLYMAFK